MKLLKIALNASVEASKEIMKFYHKEHTVQFKENKSPLTLADQKSNEIINAHLKKSLIPVISEENKLVPYRLRKTWTECWIVDPLDGTKEFIKRNGEFTVNIALVRHSKPVVGVIYVPVTNELYFADVEKGIARKVVVNGQASIEELVKQSHSLVASGGTCDKIRVAGSRSHMNEETLQFMEELKGRYKETEIISKGSSLKFCLLAEGKGDIYPRFAPTMEWDTAAGHAICNAVGLKVVGKETGQPLLYNKVSLLNPSFLVYK